MIDLHCALHAGEIKTTLSPLRIDELSHQFRRGGLCNGGDVQLHVLSLSRGVRSAGFSQCRVSVPCSFMALPLCQWFLQDRLQRCFSLT